MKLQKLRINYQQMISYTGFFILNLWYNLRMYTIKNNGIHTGFETQGENIV